MEVPGLSSPLYYLLTRESKRKGGTPFLLVRSGAIKEGLFMIKPNLNFHQTFKPERNYISTILTDAEIISGMTVQEIARQTGIPTGKSSGKVEATLAYCEYMNLIKKKKVNGIYQIDLTPIGKCVRQEDIGLSEKLTILLCHCMLVRKIGGASLWSYVFHEIFPKYRNEVEISLFLKEIEMQFGENVKMGPFYGSYEDLFSALNLVDNFSDRISVVPMIYDREFIYLYAYVLFRYWDEWYEDVQNLEMISTEEITSDQLKMIGFRNPFGWSEKEEYQVLEYLSDRNVIRMNRQLSPYTIRRLVNEETLIKELYSELC